MTIIHAAVLGIIEGFTEFLPISSTGHLILATKLLGLAQTDYVKSFEITIQFGAILAVVVLYWKRIISNSQLFKKVVVAFIPTGIIGFLLYKGIKNILGNDTIVLWALLIGGVVILLFERFHKEKIDAAGLEQINYKQAVFVGTAQAIAVVPGVSRSAATIIGGMVQNISRKAIVEFSFLLAVPTMLAATAYDLMKNPGVFSGSNASVTAVGFIFSFLAALAGIKFLINTVQNHSLSAFGIYRIVLAIILLIFLK